MKDFLKEYIDDILTVLFFVPVIVLLVELAGRAL